MKHILWFSALVSMFASIALGQSATEFTHTIESKSATSSMSANNFWIAIPKIYNTGDSGKYAEIYIASQKATTVHIRGSRFAPIDKKLMPMEQFIFRVETQDSAKSMETIGSGVVQNKGIHIWSEDADISVYAYIRNAESAGGTMILPVSSWGMEHVLVGYASGYAPAESKHPGEICLVADEDSTVVEITPKVAIGANDSAAKVLHPAGKKFTIILSRGQTVQFIQRDSGIADLTGTVITSNKPIGVISAVQRARIQYLNGESADFICEMMPPVCAWGKKYKTTTAAADEGGVYRIVASKDTQAIYIWNSDVMLQKYESRLYSLGSFTKWESDAPFLLVSYIVPSTNNLFRKYPTMLCETPEESYQKEIFFQVPIDTQLAAVILEPAAYASTTIDGMPIGWSKSAQFNDYDIYHKEVPRGAHTLRSDSAAGLYVYGSHANSFAWGGSLSPNCIKPEKDTTPPIVSTSGDCNKTTVTFTDVHPSATKIVHYITDSLENLRVELDSSFISGDLHNTFVYTLRIIDRSKPGKFRISVFDQAGNMTTVTSRIDARPNPVVAPTILQIPYAGTVANFRTFELTNTTVAQMVLTGPSGLRLSNGNNGFAFVAPDLSVLPVGAKRSFLVSYSSPSDTIHRDTVLFGDECTFAGLPLESINKGAVASTTGVDLGCISVGTSRENVFLVDNFVLYELTVLSVTFDDAAHFTAVAPTLPFIIAPEKRAGITVRYTPDAVDTNCTTARITTKELGELTATVCGCGLVSGSVNTDASQNKDELTQALRTGSDFAWLAPIPNPADRFSTMRFTFGLAKSANVALELFDIDGKRIVFITQKAYSPGIHELPVNLRSLSAGNYVYRYMADNKFYTGKLTIR